MIKKIAFAGVGLLVIVAPFLVSADAVSDLQAQVQILLAQIVALKAQTKMGASQACLTLTFGGGVGTTDARTGGEVSSLQSFLGITPTTGYFGPKTKAAVQEWQSANGINPTGYVGPLTRAAMASCVSTATNAGGTSSSTPALGTTTTGTSTTSPKYLLFQLGGIGPAGPGGQAVTVSTKAELEKDMDDLVNTIGTRGDHINRQLGMAIGPLEFDATDQQLRTIIDDAFSAAEAKNVAVAFHIDNSMFWNNRKDLWSNKNNVEWSDWSGTIVPHRIIGWVANGSSTYLAPPMCYNSPTMTAEATRIARDVIGAEVKKGVDHLNAIGKGYLFAGVIAGWETNGFTNDNGKDKPAYFGYCALHNLGYSASNPPKDIDKTLEDVLVDWITLWTKGLYDSGISRDKIYTHIPNGNDTPSGVTKPSRYYGDNPPEVAFNDYARPGFSVYGLAYSNLHTLVSSKGGGPWGVSEGTAVGLSNVFRGDSVTSISGMENYLAGAFNHGATYVNVFGWGGDNGSEFGKATTGASAIAAYKKFLRGETLQELASVVSSESALCPTPLPSGAPAKLSSECAQLQDAEKAGTIKYPVGPITSIDKLTSVLSSQFSSSNYTNVESIIQLALSQSK